MKRALAMSLEERRKRWRALMDGIERDDVVAWRDNFVASLIAAREGAKTTPYAHCGSPPRRLKTPLPRTALAAAAGRSVAQPG